MASVTSLGVQQPTALPYLIQEHLLPTEPQPNSYTWQNITYDNGEILGDDELLTTSTSVVWSRGGVVRKSFRFEVEEEPVMRAMLTYFSGDRSKQQRSVAENRQDHGRLAEDVDPARSSSTWRRESKAIVVFLKTQAYVYFLSGTSHVIHLPFEVEYATAAPHGLIIQRKLQMEKTALTSLTFPRVPPNSFISSQIPQTWSARSSQQSTFSIASLGSPKQLPLPTTALLGDLWPTPKSKDDSNWPRLFSLTDPLTEMGLLVTASKTEDNRRTSLQASTMDPAEEIIHITQRDDFKSITGTTQDALILAITLNRDTSMYTVWRMTYVEHEESLHEKPVATSGNVSRRRSSFAPGTATGATTPVPNQYPFRESLGGVINKNRREDNVVEEKLDFATTLDPEFQDSGIPRRKSRRVSSMLARADLSASHERTAFSELAGHQHVANRRGEGSQRTRNSLGLHASMNGRTHLPEVQFNSSVNSFLEAPVDDLLEELRAGGDFEGFNNMGLDDKDFEGLKKEIILSKIKSVTMEHSNIRFSSQHAPAQNRHRIFTLTAPLFATEDPQKNQIVICILDLDEKKLLVLKINVRTHNRAEYHGRKKISSPQKDLVVVTSGEINYAKNVLDACKITDGGISRIMVLSVTPDGVGQLSLQAPWSNMIQIALPEKLVMSNTRSLGHDATPQKKRDGGFRRVLSHGPRALCSLRNSLPGGIIDVVDDENQHHRLHIRMEPRTPMVKQVLDICRFALPGSGHGEDILVGWWNVQQWLGNQSSDEFDLEWTAIVVVLFALVIGFETRTVSLPERRRKSRSFPRASSGAHSNAENWQAMLAQETAAGGPQPPWMQSPGWAWLTDKERVDLRTSRKDSIASQPEGRGDGERSIQHHIRLARAFLSSPLGHAALGPTGYLPTAEKWSLNSRQKAVADIVAGLHLLREEQKLDITYVDSMNAGGPSLTPIIGQICRWLGWWKWVEAYAVEDAAMTDTEFETCNIPQTSSSVFGRALTKRKAKIIENIQLVDPPSVYDWIEKSLTTRSLVSFLTLGDVVANRLGTAISIEHWSSLIPRTAAFMRYFAAIQPASTPVEMVEALHVSGITSQILDTLPEAILVPLREAIVGCQGQPPVFWGKSLLNLVDREDVNMFLLPEQQRKVPHSALLVRPPSSQKARADMRRHQPTKLAQMYILYVQLLPSQSLLDHSTVLQK
jgi:anaphase-promoting complex subunit 1